MLPAIEGTSIHDDAVIFARFEAEAARAEAAAADAQRQRQRETCADPHEQRGAQSKKRS